MALKVKRIYDQPAVHDGYRVLVDRLWPRGVSKEQAACDEWLKDIAPSSALRTWFGHDPARFEEFRARYDVELMTNDAVAILDQILREHETVTLLYAAKNPVVNHAVVLYDFMNERNA